MPQNIYNGDETALFYKSLPYRTYYFDADKPVGSAKYKDRLTLLILLYFIFSCRLLKGISYREWWYLQKKPHDAPKLTSFHLERGHKMWCPVRWQAKAIDALHEGAENYLIGLFEDANLLATYARRVTVQPHGIQLARK